MTVARLTVHHPKEPAQQPAGGNGRYAGERDCRSKPSGGVEPPHLRSGLRVEVAHHRRQPELVGREDAALALGALQDVLHEPRLGLDVVRAVLLFYMMPAWVVLLGSVAPPSSPQADRARTRVRWMRLRMRRHVAQVLARRQRGPARA